jgi:hypothetical protein
MLGGHLHHDPMASSRGESADKWREVCGVVEDMPAHHDVGRADATAHLRPTPKDLLVCHTFRQKRLLRIHGDDARSLGAKWP